MKRILGLVASVLALSGCDGMNSSVNSGEPVPLKVTEAAQTEITPATPVKLGEVTTVTPVVEATPSSGDKSRVAATVAPEKTRELLAFDMGKFRGTRTLELPYYNDGITGFVFSPDGKTVAGVGRGRIFDPVEGGERGVVFLFDVATGALLKRLASQAKPEAKGYGPSFDRVVWSPDGKRIAAWTADLGSAAPLCVWSVASGKRTAAFTSGNENLKLATVAWMRDGLLLIARNDGSDPLAIKGQLAIGDGQTGKISAVYDLGAQTVTSIHVPVQGDPQLLMLKAVGPPRTDREPDVQSSIRSTRAS